MNNLNDQQKGSLLAFVAVIFINFFGSSSTVVIFGQLIGLFLTLIVQVYFLTPILRGYVKNERYKVSLIDWQSKISSFTRPLITIGLLSWLRIVVEKWGLLFFTTYDEAVGFYSIIYSGINRRLDQLTISSA